MAKKTTKRSGSSAKAKGTTAKKAKKKTTARPAAARVAPGRRASKPSGKAAKPKAVEDVGFEAAELAADRSGQSAALSPEQIAKRRLAAKRAAEEERDRRRSLYDDAVAKMRAVAGARRGTGFVEAPAEDVVKLRILAEGDSWFDFPFGGKMFRAGDVIARLSDLIPFPILNEAVRGDEIRSMLGATQRERLSKLLGDTKRDFNVLLFSGGGNDIVGESFCLWLNERDEVGGDVTKAVNEAAFGHALALVRHAYEQMLSIRDRVVAKTPGRRIVVFIHGYDFAIPSGQDVCGFGPWLKPSLGCRDWGEPGDSAAIVRDVLSRFAVMGRELAQVHKDVVFVESQGTLGPTEWNDELHPNRAGFPKIAAKFREALKSVFPNALP